MTDHSNAGDQRMADQQRRSDDRDRQLYSRLDQMERGHQDLVQKVNTLQLEQGHLKDIFEARLRVIEKSQDVQLAETKSISVGIQAMLSEVSRSPLGRELQRSVDIVAKEVREEVTAVHATCDEHKIDLKDLKEWQTQINGVLLILKWIGAGGLVGLGITILRLVKVLP